MKRKLILPLLFSSISFISWAQNFDKNKLDSYFTSLEQNDKFYGSVAVSENGKIIYTKTIGYADLQNNTKATHTTQYKIGSISKTFTAVLIFKAIEDGKLKLNQTINKWFPNLPNANKITVENLLNHRSGIHSFTDDKEYLNWYTQPKSQEQMVEIITKAGTDFAPNEKAVYSNSNYVLLTYILQETYKKSFAQLLDKYIIKPLKLNNTLYPESNTSYPELAKSYKFIGNFKLEKDTHPSIPLGAGGILSTPSDLVKFSDALFNHKIINKNSLTKMTQITEGFGYGLFSFPFYDKNGFGHTGGIDGFTSVFTYFSDKNISYALTSNATNYNNNNISLAVLSAIYNKPYDIPTFSTYQHTEQELNQFSGTYATAQIPIKITITNQQNTLFAQATGQDAFPLEATEKNNFIHEQANIKIEFNLTDNTLILHQGGGKFIFQKQ